MPDNAQFERVFSRDELSRNIHRRDGVALYIESRFFQKEPQGHAKYLGYVVSISPQIIWLSITHPDNVSPEYSSEEERKIGQQVLVSIETKHIIGYKIVDPAHAY